MNTKSKAILAYVVIFLVGGASGYFLNDALQPQFPDLRLEQGPGWNNQQDPPDRRPRQNQRRQRRHQRMESFLARELELDENQVEPFFNRLEEHQNQLHETVREYRDQEIDTVRELYSEFRSDVGGILTEQQLQELDRIAHPDSVSRRMGRRGPPQLRE